MESIGHYQVVRQLGAGAMGEVFLARDERLGREVAVKLLSNDVAGSEEQRRRFRVEARSAASLSHPNVCVIYEIGEADDGRPFIAMEYLQGQSLEERIESGSISVAEALDITAQIAEALECAHDAGVVHRDIKPANVHLGPRNRVKVLDFGLAKRFGNDPLEGATTQLVATQAGTVLGTPAYMSPEQALGSQVDQRSDLFSLGALLYHLLTGRLPFQGSTLGELLNNVLSAQPEAIARFNYEVPPQVERIVRKLLAKDPDRRFQTARGLLVDIEDARSTLGERATEPLRGLETIEVSGPADPGSATGSTGTSAPSSPAGPSPAELAASDVVIAYAPLDDRPAVTGKASWVSQFHNSLQFRVAQLSGREVSVVKQPDPAAPEAEIEVLGRVPDLKTVVSVLSPPFVNSAGCCKIVEHFWKTAKDTGRFVVKDRARLLNVVKTPVEASEIPGELNRLYSSLPAYEFFEREKDSGRVREFDEAFGEAAKQRFFERVYDVAYDVAQVLRHLGESDTATESRADRPLHGKKVYLAVTTSDLDHHRDILRRELLEAGCDVYPKQPLPFVASEIESVVESCLEQCDLAIHFVGRHYGFVPEATDLSIVALQHRVATALAERSALERIIWQPRALDPADERQARFLRDLEEGESGRHGAEIIADNLENLKVLLRHRWEKEAAARAAAATARNSDAGEQSVSGPSRVYLICDQADEEATEPLQDYLYEEGIEVSLPGFDAGEAEVQEIHIRNLRDCDGALIFYGAAGMHWVDFNVRDLQKAAGYRDGRPIAASVVYLAPPFNRRKERFRSVSVGVIKQDGDGVNRRGLSEFVSRLARNRKEAGQ